MTVEKTTNVKLTDEEKECLRQANYILREIYNKVCDASDYSSEIELEDDVQDIINDIYYVAGSI